MRNRPHSTVGCTCLRFRGRDVDRSPAWALDAHAVGPNVDSWLSSMDHGRLECSVRQIDSMTLWTPGLMGERILAQGVGQGRFDLILDDHRRAIALFDRRHRLSDYSSAAEQSMPSQQVPRGNLEGNRVRSDPGAMIRVSKMSLQGTTILGQEEDLPVEEYPDGGHGYRRIGPRQLVMERIARTTSYAI